MRSIFFLLIVTFLAFLPEAGAAQCKQWNITGRWGIEQSNGFQISVDIEQLSGVLRGQTISSAARKDIARVDGNITGDDVYFKLSWQGQTGIYRGKIGSSGRIDGTTYDKNYPDSKATWFSTIPMRCGTPYTQVGGSPLPPLAIPSSILAPPPPKKTIKTTGKPRPPANVPTTVTETTNTAPAAVDLGPRIKAMPANGFGLHKTNGKTTLTRDGGKDHPYAEVWVKIDDGEETFVVEQGKGSMQVTIEPGKTYVYILTDSGKSLARTTLKFQ